MTGWRLGASIGPKEVVDVIAKINVNPDESCSNHFVQWGGLAGLQGDQTEVTAIVDTLEFSNSRWMLPHRTTSIHPRITVLSSPRGSERS